MYSIIFILAALMALLAVCGQLRGLAFYGTGGSTGTAATIFDPMMGTAVTKIPQAGQRRAVAIRGCTFVTDQAGDHEEYCEIRIGQDGQGDAHRVKIFPHADGDTPTPETNGEPMFPLGNFIVAENIDLSILLFDPDNTALCSGVLWYDDLEPEIPIPRGRIVTFQGPTTADYTTTFSATGGGNFTNLPNVACKYAVIGAEVRPEDALVQVLALRSSGEGKCAVLPPKGRMWFPSVPLVFDGLEVVQLQGQVQAVTEVGVIVFAVEVPKTPGSVANADVVALSPATYHDAVDIISGANVADISSIGETIRRL